MHILDWLEGGNLRSDGAANQAAEAVLKHDELIGDLVEGLNRSSDVLRGRTADALEKIARTRPDLILPFHPLILDILGKDSVAMVKWHLAMCLGHLACYEEIVPSSKTALINLLNDDAVFTKSWAISSLCIIACLYPQYKNEIIQALVELKNDASIAIQTRVRKAMETLLGQNEKLPGGWNKSSRIDL